ncbi:MAG TPA: hypothetical protein VH540_10320 [Ktedonobacterales bacterium]|jgi:phage terminase small subunit
MAYETYFNADDLDLDAALLAGFGLKKETEKETEEVGIVEVDEVTTVTTPSAAADHEKVAHAQITHRVGKVGRLQVTFVYHHGEGPHK